MKTLSNQTRQSPSRTFWYKKGLFIVLFSAFFLIGITANSEKAYAVIICAIPPWHANNFETCPQDHDPWEDPPPLTPGPPGPCVFAYYTPSPGFFVIPERCPQDPDCTLCHQAGIDAFHESFLETIFVRLWELREWYERRDEWLPPDAFWTDHLRATLHRMTEHLTATAYTQVGMIGRFFDAKHQLERQAVLTQAHVDAIKAYQPSEAMCRFGTATRPLASSEHLSHMNKQLLSSRSLKRQLRNTGSVGHSSSKDLSARLAQFRSIYCDPAHLNGKLTESLEKDPICGENGGEPERYNKDINVTSTLFSPATLDVNFTDTSSTEDEQDILALSANLYAYEVIDAPKDMGDKDEGGKEAQQFYHRYRSLLAKRNIAENSFNTLVGLKAKGSGASTDYLIEMMEGLGYADSDEIEAMLSDAPSYDAQMQILTKKIYQNPAFITSLIDKPENVKRQKAAMMALELMQRRDAYKSALRQEMIIAVLLELFLDDRFKEVKGKIDELVIN